VLLQQQDILSTQVLFTVVHSNLGQAFRKKQPQARKTCENTLIKKMIYCLLAVTSKCYFHLD